MKIRILLLAFLAVLTTGFLFADTERISYVTTVTGTHFYYRFSGAYPPIDPVEITLTVGDSLCIEGDRCTEIVGGNEIRDPGVIEFDGVHMVKYEGGIGGCEGVKTIYNFNLWSFNKSDYMAQIADGLDSSLIIKENHDIRGLWKFKAVGATPENTPQELMFTNKDGSVAAIEVTVNNAP